MKKGLFLVKMLGLVLTIGSCNNNKSTLPAQEAPVVENNVPTAVEASTDLPALPLIKLDGTPLMANNLSGKTVLFFFQPDCDHCQRETVQIRENLAAFRDYKVYFITNAGLPELRKFSQDYKIAFEPNFTFAQATIENILNTVGPMDSPSLFIYSNEGQLVKAFNGETPIEQILPGL
ncbi:MAG: hypothetical protein JWQ14_584 [Adhaeribacter sp.]|nr:hypothetical protein [Adhaeribacter sp.]